MSRFAASVTSVVPKSPASPGMSRTTVSFTRPDSSTRDGSTVTSGRARRLSDSSATSIACLNRPIVAEMPSTIGISYPVWSPAMTRRRTIVPLSVDAFVLNPFRCACVEDEVDGEVVVEDRVLDRLPDVPRELVRRGDRLEPFELGVDVALDEAAREERRAGEPLRVEEVHLPGLQLSHRERRPDVDEPVPRQLLRRLHQTEPGLVVEVRIVGEPDHDSAWIGLEVELGRSRRTALR